MIRQFIRRALGLPDQPGMVTVSADTHTIDLFRFHPVTGQDANDLDGFSVTPETREEIAEMIRNGAVFYWKRRAFMETEHHSGYVRIEWTNFAFDMFSTGKNVIRHETDWTKNKPAV